MKVAEAAYVSYKELTEKRAEGLVSKDLQIALAEDKLNELRAQLELFRPEALARWRAGMRALDDLERVMVLDAEIERAAVHLRALMLREG